MTSIKETTMQELVERYPVILFDSFGVLASSNAVLPGAVELIAELNLTGKTYFVLTNDASALPESRSLNYAKLNLTIQPDQIITSGGLLSRYFAEENLQGLRCVVLGPEDSIRYVEEAGGEVVRVGDSFDAVVIGDQAGFPFLKIGIDPVVIILAIVVSFIIGVISGAVPAIQASKLKPVDALRYE